MMAYSCKTWKFCEQFLWVLFGKTTPYGKIFKILYESFHCVTDRLVLKCRKIF